MPGLEEYWQASIVERIVNQRIDLLPYRPRKYKFWGSRDRNGYMNDELTKTRTIPASWLG